MAGPRRIGVMGGTFDPIHHGHLVAAAEVQSVFGLEQVVFVPTGRPWQKDDRRVSPAEQRYLMTVVATASNPDFTVSRVDVDRDGPTYTIDTLRDLRDEHPDTEPALHHRCRRDGPDPVVEGRRRACSTSRASWGSPGPATSLSLQGLPPERVSLLEIPALSISSTDCRERVRAGQPVWYLVPDGVVQYIAKYGLYRTGEPADR
ncbi:putative nicotinate-nucleotide adenylyltransferase [Angustibacter aerolatus]|uniref:Probable nicotinate-nucleotide adenylyltransferase n=1 Tax=Angustibacter aerolatus TaxID=1162965 RepID=A0ABQ6JEY2_9ACTN|nr:nicotinate-nucleotide adenylyltransferase [Angustibacter aerolatus]GMA85699.1 putative nicotinate-nucleotide adenylyltransferase [Angustibacter aerolatus]